MSTAKANKLYRTFLKGLVTEASPLTFPPDTSYDEDNCLIFVAGNRARRLGMDYETGYTLSSHSLSVANSAQAPIVEYVWRNANNVEGLDLLCHQVRDRIYFYDCSGNPTSPSLKSFSIDLNSYYISGSIDPENKAVQMVSGKGYLFITASSIEPLIITYNENTDSISAESIVIHIRDFDGVDDDLGVEEEPNTLSDTHNYNLQNQGWINTTNETKKVTTLLGRIKTITYGPGLVDPIAKYKEVVGKFPANSKQWFVGKVEVSDKNYQVGDFSPQLLNKFHVGNSRAPRGHFIVNAFNKDRAAVSGIAGLASENKTTRPSSCCFAVGRIFFGHENSVYFSQILSSKDKAGLCFQDNDPTAENLSDLLDNDGGVIPIPSCDRIVLTKDVANGIMVFANNGVWFISGGDKGFTASDYQVTKISSIGTESPYSIVDTENHIYWWSKTGIQRIEQSSGMFGPISGSFKSINLTENTIDTFFKDIPTTSRKHVKGVFDHGTNTIHWLYATEEIGKDFFYNRLINFNVITESFFPWSLGSGAHPYIVGAYITSDINRLSNEQTVVDTSNETVVTSVNETVTALGTVLSAKDSFVQFTVAVPASSVWNFTIGNFTNDNYADWESYDGTGIAYTSFVETGFEILDDAARKKQIVYLQPFFRQTEENVFFSGDDPFFDQPSSCFLTTKWDWTNSTASNKWATRTQVYRLRNVPFVEPTDTALDTGHKIVTTRNRVRGQGRALQFRFECNEIGKNFDLLGWQVFYQGNTEL